MLNFLNRMRTLLIARPSLIQKLACVGLLVFAVLPAAQAEDELVTAVTVAGPHGPITAHKLQTPAEGTSLRAVVALARTHQAETGVPTHVVVVDGSTNANASLDLDSLSKFIVVLNMGYEIIYYLALHHSMAQPHEVLPWLTAAVPTAGVLAAYNYVIEYKNKSVRWGKWTEKQGERLGHIFHIRSQDLTRVFVRPLQRIGLGPATTFFTKTLESKGDAFKRSSALLSEFTGVVALYWALYATTTALRHAPAFEASTSSMFFDSLNLLRMATESGAAFFVYRKNLYREDGQGQLMPRGLFNSANQARNLALAWMTPFMVMSEALHNPTIAQQIPTVQNWALGIQSQLQQHISMLDPNSLTQFRNEIFYGGLATGALIQFASRYLSPENADALRKITVTSMLVGLPTASLVLSGQIDLSHPTWITGASLAGNFLYSLSGVAGATLFLFGDEALAYDKNRVEFLKRMDARLEPIRQSLTSLAEMSRTRVQEWGQVLSKFWRRKPKPSQIKAALGKSFARLQGVGAEAQTSTEDTAACKSGFDE
jgi:hypothetical protein